MEFKNKIDIWANEGVPPDEEREKNGFQGGYHPPAGIFNWFFCLVSKCINELQNLVAKKAEDDLSNVDNNIFKTKVKNSGAVFDVDSELSYTSENPVQNKVVANKFDTKIDKSNGVGLMGFGTSNSGGKTWTNILSVNSVSGTPTIKNIPAYVSDLVNDLNFISDSQDTIDALCSKYGLTRTEVVSYVGNGMSGKRTVTNTTVDYTMSLTFSFPPKIVWIYAMKTSSGIYPTSTFYLTGTAATPVTGTTANHTIFPVSEFPTTESAGAGYGFGRTPTFTYGSSAYQTRYGWRSADGKTIYWYTHSYNGTTTIVDQGESQMNASGVTYYAVAFGAGDGGEFNRG